MGTVLLHRYFFGTYCRLQPIQALRLQTEKISSPSEVAQSSVVGEREADAYRERCSTCGLSRVRRSTESRES